MQTRNIEMIKARFGEANIQSCDVMLKDIIESKRVDRLIHNRTANVPPQPHTWADEIDYSPTDPVTIFLASIAGRETRYARATPGTIRELCE